jgi:hypothetical protein
MFFSSEAGAFTREQDTYIGTQRSYLDYFLTKGILNAQLKILPPIGNSDHKTIRLEIFDRDLSIQRRLNLVFPFGKLVKKSEEIERRLIETMAGTKHGVNTVSAVSELIRELWKESRMINLKQVSHFRVVEGLENLTDKTELKKKVQSANREQFLAFMAAIAESKMSRKEKEFFAKMRFYTELDRKTGILDDMTVTDEEFGEVVTTDKEEINRMINNKYRKQFEDLGEKLLLPLLSDEVVEYTPAIIAAALDKINLRKAVSWDLIPGVCLQNFPKCQKLLEIMANFINELVRLPVIPIEISLGRLFCLNKDSTNPGTINSIRPLTIIGPFIKIIEFPLLQELKQLKLNKAQIGFVERMGAELNIIRLRDHYRKLKEKPKPRGKSSKSYLLFIDLKQAFDAVRHPILVKKLLAKGLGVPVINTLIKLMNSSAVSVNHRELIWVNCGVGQGKLCSPLMFDVYIDDLLNSAEGKCFLSLAYADDTAFLAENLAQLKEVSEICKKWSLENGIEINFKKSGVLILGGDNTDPTELENFPVVSEYKYLGVTLNSHLTPMTHIYLLNRKLKEYFRRNSFLHKKVFSVSTLTTLVDLFVTSRASYGMCAFLDSPSILKIIEQTILRHLKSILGLPKETSHKKIQLVLGEPDLRVKLALRLLKIWHKHREQFGEYPSSYEKTLCKYFDRGLLQIEPEDYANTKRTVTNLNLKEIGKDYIDMEIRDDHNKFLRKHFFTHPDSRDLLVIRFLTGTTKETNLKLFPVCICGQQNSRGHALNECEVIMSSHKRKEYMNKFAKLLKAELSLLECVHKVYFNIIEDKNTNGKSIRVLYQLVKEVIVLVTLRKKDADPEP